MQSKSIYQLVFIVFTVLLPLHHGAKQGRNLIEDVEDPKVFKKLIRTKTNLLAIFAKNDKAASKYNSIFADVALEMKGKATLAYIDCSEAKKLCKNWKVNPSTVDLKHYKDGNFNKDYDRRMVTKSMINFLLDPTGDVPWEEEPTATDVVHIDSPESFNKLLRKDKHPILVMFYAPWCGFCKRLKPDFAAAATEVKGQATLVGVDVDKPAQMPLRVEYNITGFPTLFYFEKGKKKFAYGGENNKDGIVSWLKHPKPPQEKPKETEWADEESDVVHLTDDSFDTYLKENPSVLVMFYAPWCGHCKKMKPEYTSAASKMKAEGITGTLAAVDATKEKKTGDSFKVQGFPTVKYFKDGEFAFDFNERTEDKILEFMKDPKEPPPPPAPEPNWSEMESEVVHLTDENFKSYLKKKKHALVMFYAPWCGHCKKAKPEYMQAAEKFKDDGKVAFAAMDCTTQTAVCGSQEVTGYPTFKYFKYGKNPQNYMGGREEADFVNFMKDPQNPGATPPPPAAEPPEKQWADVAGMENLHFLTEENFDSFIEENPSVLVMFYAPWCGHCKAMKPAYGEAAAMLTSKGISGALAAVDATAQSSLGNRFNVRGYPTLKYFKNGKEAFDYNKGRSTQDLVEFMKNPQEPPPPPPQDPEWSSVPSAVQHLDSDSFNKVLKDKAAALVMFYAPWCGHCKKAKPHFQNAADELAKKDKNRIFAAVDCTKNDDICSKEKVEGYPTIKLYTNGNYLQEYSGGRSKSDFLTFLKNAPVRDEL